MEKWILHLQGTRKSGYALICFGLIIPLFYSVAHIADNSFDPIMLLLVVTLSLAGGAALAFIGMTGDFFKTERMKSRLSTIHLKRIGDGLQLLDRYTGWQRRIEIDGTYENRKVWISPRFQRRLIGNHMLCLSIYMEPSEYAIAEIELKNSMTSDDAVQMIIDKLSANKVKSQGRSSVQVRN